MKSRVLYLYDKVKLQAEVTPYQSRCPIDKGIGYISRHSSVIDVIYFYRRRIIFPPSVIHMLELHFFSDPEAAFAVGQLQILREMFFCRKLPRR